jgi:hypothetical protein
MNCRPDDFSTDTMLFQSNILANYFDLPARTETLWKACDFWFRRKPCPTDKVAKRSQNAARSALRRGVVCIALGWYVVALSYCIAILTLGWVWAGFVIMSL